MDQVNTSAFNGIKLNYNAHGPPGAAALGDLLATGLDRAGVYALPVASTNSQTRSFFTPR
jgi:hypothetical protein